MKTLILKSLLVLLYLIPSHIVVADQQDAIKYLQNGKFDKAYQEFSILAKQGNHIAMVALGNMHYKGNGIEKNYKLAMDWWMKAYDLGNPDAIANIGVLYRDGKGVTKNLMIAYDIFLLIQLKDFGGPEIQIRNNSNMIKTVSRMKQSEIEEALCYSEEYISRYLTSQGEGTVVQYKDEISLKQKLKYSNSLNIPEYDCHKYQS